MPQEGVDAVGALPRRMPRRSVVRSLSTMHMMGFTPLGFFETVSEGANLLEGRMSLPTGQVAALTMRKLQCCCNSKEVLSSSSSYMMQRAFQSLFVATWRLVQQNHCQVFATMVWTSCASPWLCEAHVPHLYWAATPQILLWHACSLCWFCTRDFCNATLCSKLILHALCIHCRQARIAQRVHLLFQTA